MNRPEHIVDATGMEMTFGLRVLPARAGQRALGRREAVVVP
jgi:hypothetical protein